MSKEKNLAILAEIRKMARQLPIGTAASIINKCNKAQIAINKGRDLPQPGTVVDLGPGGQEHFDSQAKAVLAYMREGNTITPFEALRLFGIISFPRRILDIEKLTGIAPKRRRIQVTNRHGKQVYCNEYWWEEE